MNLWCQGGGNLSLQSDTRSSSKIRSCTLQTYNHDFLYQVFQMDVANHLFSVFHDKYSITIEWSGDSYLGLLLNDSTKKVLSIT